jgi:hypothetical protein
VGKGILTASRMLASVGASVKGKGPNDSGKAGDCRSGCSRVVGLKGIGNLAGAILGEIEPTDDALVDEPIDALSDDPSSERANLGELEGDSERLELT